MKFIIYESILCIYYIKSRRYLLQRVYYRYQSMFSLGVKSSDKVKLFIQMAKVYELQMKYKKAMKVLDKVFLTSVCEDQIDEIEGHLKRLKKKMDRTNKKKKDRKTDKLIKEKG